MRANMEPHEWESELRQVNSHLRLKLAAVEKESDEYKQRWRDAINELIRVGIERDEYKDEYVTLATAYWELRRTLKKIASQTVGQSLYSQIYKLAETALRKAVEEKK